MFNFRQKQDKKETKEKVAKPNKKSTRNTQNRQDTQNMLNVQNNQSTQSMQNNQNIRSTQNISSTQNTQHPQEANEVPSPISSPVATTNANPTPGHLPMELTWLIDPNNTAGYPKIRTDQSIERTRYDVLNNEIHPPRTY